LSAIDKLEMYYLQDSNEMRLQSRVKGVVDEKVQLFSALPEAAPDLCRVAEISPVPERPSQVSAESFHFSQPEITEGQSDKLRDLIRSESAEFKEVEGQPMARSFVCRRLAHRYL